MQPGAAEDLPKTPRAASYLLMGSRPQWPPFGAKPHNCKYSYGVSPGLSPGFFYPPATQRSGARDDDTMYKILICFIAHLQDLVNLFLASNHKRYRGSRGLPPSCRGASILPHAALLHLDDMDIRQLIVRLPGDDIGKQGDIRILQPLGGRGDGDIDAVVGHVSNAIGVPLGDN